MARTSSYEVLFTKQLTYKVSQFTHGDTTDRYKRFYINIRIPIFSLSFNVTTNVKLSRIWTNVKKRIARFYKTLVHTLVICVEKYSRSLNRDLRLLNFSGGKLFCLKYVTPRIDANAFFNFTTMLPRFIVHGYSFTISAVTFPVQYL